MVVPSDRCAALVGGPLHDEEYVFWQMHMHWGSSDQWGSEHLLDGHAFSAELHIVHYKVYLLDCHVLCCAVPESGAKCTVQFEFDPPLSTIQYTVVRYINLRTVHRNKIVFLSVVL